MAKNEIPNTWAGFETCIVGCKYAYSKDGELNNYECTCERECKGFDQFDVPELQKHKEAYIRKQTIEKTIPIVLEYCNKLSLKLEGAPLFYKNSDGKEKAIEELMDMIRKEINISY